MVKREQVVGTSAEKKESKGRGAEASTFSGNLQDSAEGDFRVPSEPRSSPENGQNVAKNTDAPQCVRPSTQKNTKKKKPQKKQTPTPPNKTNNHKTKKQKKKPKKKKKKKTQNRIVDTSFEQGEDGQGES